MIADLQAWRDLRRAELRAPDSWLGVVGLHWLEAGRNAVGSGAGTPVRLPSGPEYLGEIIWQDGCLRWRSAEASETDLQTDGNGDPTIIECGSLAFFVIERDGQLAVRVRDRNWAAGRPPVVLEYFADAPSWCVEAQWQAIEPPLQMEVPNVSGELKRVTVGHRALFSHEGDEVALLPMSVAEDHVFFVFRDRSSGKETYGAGRFLKAAPARDGRIVLDFNRAFNPPCAFTSFATCQLPPPENWLPFAVLAGERKWLGK